MTHFNVTMISDNVCPWCFVGKRRLEKAISLYKEKHPEENATFKFEQKPFYLDPTAPKVGVDKRQRYNEKFGPERAAAAQARITSIGEETGIKFRWDGKTGNTRDSHRLVELAKSKGEERQLRVIEKILEAYFENAQDITAHETLQEAGVAGGLPEGEVRDVLGSDQYGQEVDRQVAEAQQLGVTGVPHFILNDAFEFSGGQEPAAFLQLFERLKSKGLA